MIRHADELVAILHKLLPQLGKRELAVGVSAMTMKSGFEHALLSQRLTSS